MEISPSICCRQDAQPGEEVTLSVRMKLDKGWHAYAQSQEEGPGGTPTAFDLQSFQGLIDCWCREFVANQARGGETK